jgi:predicted Zn-dependent protease
MANESGVVPVGMKALKPVQVYGLAAICLAAGLGLGYLLRMELGGEAEAPTKAVVHAPPTLTAGMGGGHVVTIEEMKATANAKAAPLIDKLKSTPNDAALLVQIGAIYHAFHQYQDAETYYGRAVQVDPKNVAHRVKLSSSLFRAGDADGALTQLNQALGIDPKDANALFDLGMVKLQGKQDAKGALAAWQQLLKSNPQLSADRKAAVQKLISEVKKMPADHFSAGGPSSK